VFCKNRTKFKSPGISSHLLCVKICRHSPHVLSQTVGLGWSRVEFIEIAASRWNLVLEVYTENVTVSLCQFHLSVCVGLISPTGHKENKILLGFTTIGSLHRKHYGLNGTYVWEVLISSCLGYDFLYFCHISKCMKECVVQHNVTPTV
jgi:hypothetical protein